MPILQQSVQSLLIEMSFQGTKLSTGTGFLVSRCGIPALITNRHNFTGRHQETRQPLSSHGGVPDSVTIWQNSFNGLGHWHQEQHSLYDADGNPKWKEHPALGAEADIVGLQLIPNVLTKTYPYNVGPQEVDFLVAPGDALSVIGFPFGLTGGGRFAIWATGFLATEPDVDYDDKPIFLVDCRSRQGQSGSPVVASRSGGMVALSNGSTVAFGGPVSTFLGIYSGRINDQSDLGIVWKRSAIAELVETL
jgi:hypothetical protein